MEGYIKDYRKELQSDIWMMPPLYHRVWQYIKYKVNHAPREIPMRDGTKMKIKAGQHLTSVRKIAQEVGWYERGLFKNPNPKTVTQVIEWLEKSNMIYTDKGNRQYTLITVVNWGIYQGNEVAKVTESNQSKVTESNQLMDINNNEKNEKNNNVVVVDKPKNSFEFYEDNFGMASPFMIDELNGWVDDITDEVVIKAMQITLENNKRNWAYTKGILRDWIGKGVKSIEDVEALQREYELSKGDKKDAKHGRYNESNTSKSREDEGKMPEGWLYQGRVGWIKNN